MSDPTSTEKLQPLPDHMGKPLEDSLSHLVDNSRVEAGSKGSGKDQLAPSEKRNDAIHAHGNEHSKSWLGKFFPSAETIDKLFSYEHMGNFVIDRKTGRKIFETMPIYVRVGMHLLFVDGCKYMSSESVEKLLLNQSIKQGKIYDETGPGVKQHIQTFIDTYQLPLDELLIKDLDAYPTFNAFFSRRLTPTARPITSPEDPTLIISPADCRMTAFQSVDKAKTFWIKGKQFTIPSLLTGSDASETTFDAIKSDTKALIAVSRLAPQDYHRFHSPVEGVVVSVKDIPGELYTVNPQAINEDLNVFTSNKRSVMLIHANFGPGKSQVPMAFVAVGAMLVGSIGWSKKAGDKIAKGEELGWFQYGGSTTITVYPSSAGIQFDQDILDNSEKSMETLVKVGMEIGKVRA